MTTTSGTSRRLRIARLRAGTLLLSAALLSAVAPVPATGAASFLSAAPAQLAFLNVAPAYRRLW